MQTRSRRHPAAFTLIELMVTITIIVILAGLVIAGTGYVNDRQARSQARVQIALLEKAIQEYHMDMGRYPGEAANTPATGDVSEELYQALFYDGWYYQENNKPRDAGSATKIYLPELDPRTSRMGWVDRVTNPNSPPPARIPILDPWGNNYHYRKGNNAQNPDFDLWSHGKDGRHDTGSLNHRDNQDDIGNF